MVGIALCAQAAKPAHKAATKTASQPAATPAAATPAAATPAAATPAATAAPAPAAAQPTSSGGAATESTSGSASGSASASTGTGTNTSWSSSGEGTVAAPAAAPFGAAHHLIISVERAFGVSFWSEKFSGGGISTKQSGTAINLLNGSDSDVYGPAATPRIAFDFAVIRNVTVGAFVGYSHRSATFQSAGSASLSAPGRSSALLGLRGGYTLALTDMFTFWPRAGLHYYSGHLTSGNTLSGVLVNIEPTLVVTPVSHLGFTIGAVADLPLSGSQKDTPTGISYSDKLMNFGLAVGLLGYL